MMSSVLSQEEIDALLNDTFAPESDDNNKMAGDNGSIDSIERDALGEIANISMGAAATTLSSLLGKRVEITTPQLMTTTIEELKKKYPKPYVIVDVNYDLGLEGGNLLIIHTYDAGIIVDLMMGGDGSNPPMELNDLHLSAVSEAMNQMMGSSCTSLSQILNKRINISPPSLDLLHLGEGNYFLDDSMEVVCISFRVHIQGLVDSEMMQLIPVKFAKQMVRELLHSNDMTQYQPHKELPVNEFHQPVSNMAHETYKPVSNNTYEDIPIREKQVAVSNVQFNQLNGTPNSSVTPPNMDLILDVGLQLSVELGRTHKTIKDIIELSVGSVIELDKLAGEPVDVLVNGKLLAKGEVVVIDENFGVRVTEILTPTERVKNLR